MKKYLYEDLFSLEGKHWWHIAKRRAVYKLIKKYSHLENPKILDIGCGTGKNMDELQKLGTVYGLHHEKRYNINTLKEILVANNFHPVKMTYLYSFLILPMLIIRKIKQNISKDFYESDFKLSNPLFNFLLNNLSRFEFLLAENFYIPFGTSIFSGGKK